MEGKYEKKCIVCGKAFTTDISNKQICSEKCLRERTREYWRRSRQKWLKKRKEKNEKQKTDDAEKEKLNFLIREEHLSYGKARARLYLEHMKESEGRLNE